MRPGQFLDKWREFERNNKLLSEAVRAQTDGLSVSSELFFERVIGFKPYLHQKEFIDLFEANQFTAARWCRQSCKIQIILFAAKVHYLFVYRATRRVRQSNRFGD